MPQQPLHDLGVALVHGVEKRTVPGIRSKVSIHFLRQEDIDDGDVAAEGALFLKIPAGAAECTWRAFERLDDLGDIRIMVAIAGKN